MAERRPSFDPYGILQALERHRVKYVLIGAVVVIPIWAAGILWRLATRKR